MKQCIHCFKEATTKDHVFPSSWYTSDTRRTVQRWTVPSCRKCNEKFGAMEQELLIKMIPCIDPAKPGVAGLRKKVYASLGMGMENELGSAEYKIRRAQASKLYAEFRQYTDGMPVYPNFGPHAGFPAETQHTVFIPKASVEAVLGKIFRGAEFKLNNKRLIKPPYELEIMDRVLEEIPEVELLLNRFARSQHLGPGFRLDRVAGSGEIVLYKTVIWDTWVAYGCIDTKS